MDDTIFRKFRSKQDEVWQVDFYESPFWTVPDEGGMPFKSRMAVCRSVRTGRHTMSPPVPGEPGLEALREVVALAARMWRLRPERIEVADSRLAGDLGGLLSAEGVPVEVRPDLPELRALLVGWARAARGAAPPGVLSVPGVTVERIAAFARAAARFAVAAPWRLLDVDDVLVLEAAGLPEELRCARVLGPPGFAQGVLFHAEEHEDELMTGDEWDEEDWEDPEPWEDEELFSEEGHWKVSLLPPSVLPPEDVELWVRHGLPVAHSRAHPMALRSRRGEEAERPDSRLLSWFEAVLAALASTTEEEMDAGRWEKEVVTSEGPVRLVLSLPNVLLPSYADDLPWEDDGVPVEMRMADELATEALEAWGRRQIHLARRAVALWPDCIDARLVLARRALDRETARDLYAEAVAAGERLFAGIIGRRDIGLLPEADRSSILPYLWARLGLAKALWRLGEREEAVGHLQGKLAVDPDDPKRTRYLLAYALLALGRYDEAGDLLIRWKEDRFDWWYTRALLTFRREGDSPTACRQLAAALRSGRYVAKQLLGATPGPTSAGCGWEEDQGADDDTVFVQDVWRETPGALDWLRAQSAASAGAAQVRKAKKKNKKKHRKRRRK